MDRPRDEEAKAKDRRCCPVRRIPDTGNGDLPVLRPASGQACTSGTSQVQDTTLDASERGPALKTHRETLQSACNRARAQEINSPVKTWTRGNPPSSHQRQSGVSLNGLPRPANGRASRIQGPKRGTRSTGLLPLPANRASAAGLLPSMRGPANPAPCKQKTPRHWPSCLLPKASRQGRVRAKVAVWDICYRRWHRRHQLFGVNSDQGRRGAALVVCCRVLLCAACAEGKMEACRESPS